jgi:hypothetical protein
VDVVVAAAPVPPHSLCQPMLAFWHKTDIANFRMAALRGERSQIRSC